MMRFFSPVSILIVALVAPFTILCQRHGHDGRDGDIVYTTLTQQATPVAVSASSLPRTEAAVVTTPATTQASSQVSPATPIASSTSNTPNSTCTGSGMTIAWTGDEVSYSWSGGTGTTTGCLSLGTFNGQLEVGGSGGTIFEGNYNNGAMYYDVSFITGFSVPMMCSSSAGSSGCSIDLFSQGTACPQQSGSVCTNPVGMNGNKQPGSYGGDMNTSPWCYACSAPDPFFQPCAGSAYTYPYDDGATQSADGTITCCVGTSCGETGREGSTKDGHAEPDRSSEPCQMCSSGGSKRGLDEILGRRGEEGRGLSSSLLARGYRGFSHRHGLAHGVKGMR